MRPSPPANTTAANEIDLDALVTSRVAFDEFVYTSPREAMRILRARKSNAAIHEMPNLPDSLAQGFLAVMTRQVATPNFDTRQFINLVAELGIKPVFAEWRTDKFVPNNGFKHHLGKLRFHDGERRSGGANLNSVRIIDFNASNGKKLNSISTLWGQPLTDFHRSLFLKAFPQLEGNVHDLSDWFEKIVDLEYYERFLSFTIRGGILFENFVRTGRESTFTRHVFLPAFVRLFRETGHKPLIVAIAPTETEDDDDFWLGYPRELRSFLDERLLQRGSDETA